MKRLLIALFLITMAAASDSEVDIKVEKQGAVCGHCLKIAGDGENKDKLAVFSSIIHALKTNIKHNHHKHWHDDATFNIADYTFFVKTKIL